MSILTLTNVSKGFGENPVLCDISMSVEQRKFVAILGFSGTDETKLINLIAGLGIPDIGTITYRDKPVTGPAPERGANIDTNSRALHDIDSCGTAAPLASTPRNWPM